MQLPDLAAIEDAAEIVYQHMQPSAQLNWPLLDARAGCEVWVKHENHNPTGAFKIRGGLLYLERQIERQPDCPGICAALLKDSPASADRVVLVLTGGNINQQLFRRALELAERAALASE